MNFDVRWPFPKVLLLTSSKARESRSAGNPEVDTTRCRGTFFNRNRSWTEFDGMTKAEDALGKFAGKEK